jgi:hypothetical protein
MAGGAFTQTVVLDGGDKVAKQLAEIGKSGEQAFKQIGDATKSASQNLNSAQSVFGQIASAFQGMVQQVADAGQAFGRAFDPLISAGSAALGAATRTGAGFGAVAGAAAGISGAIGKIGQEAANSVAKLNDAATAAGLTMEKYSALRAAFEGVGVGANVLDKMVQASERAARGAELKGGPSHFRRAPESADQGDDAESADKAAASVGKLTESILGAERAASDLPRVFKAVNGAFEEVHAGDSKSQGLGGYAQAAGELGVALRDMYGKARPGIEIARDVVLSLGKMADGARRADIAARAFGEGLAREVLAVADNREAINALAAAHERSAATMSEAQKKQADDARATGAILASVKASWLEYYRSLATPVTIDQNNAIIVFFERNKQALKDFGDNVVGPAIRWLGQFQNSFGAVSIAAAALGSSLRLLSPVAATAFGAAGIAAIVFGDKIKDGALAAMTELTRIVKANDLSTFAGWKNAAGAVWEDIKQIAFDAWAEIRQRVAAVDWAAAWADFKAAAFNAWDNLRQQIAAIDWAGLWDRFTSIASDAMGAAVKIAGDAYGAIKSAAVAAFPGLVETFVRFEQFAKDTMTAIKGFSKETWIAIGVGLAAAAIVWRGSFLGLALGAAPFWEEILVGAARISPAFRAIVAPIRASMAGLIDGMLQLWRNFWTVLSNPADVGGAANLERAAGFAGFRAAAIRVWGEVQRIFVAGVRGIRSTIEGAFPEAKELFSGFAASASRLYAALRILGVELSAFLAMITLGKVSLGPWEALFLAFGLHIAGILPLFTSLITFIGLAITGIGHLAGAIVAIPSAIQTMGGVIASFWAVVTSPAVLAIAAIVALAVAVGNLYNHWNELTAAGRAFYSSLAVGAAGVLAYVAAINIIPAVATAAGAAITVFTAIVRGLSAAFLFMSATPWGAIIAAAIILVAVALYALYTHWDQVKLGAQAAWSAITNGANAAWSSIKSAAEGFFGWLEAKWNALKDLGGSLWDKFKTGANSAWEGVKAAFTDSITWIETKWDALIAKIKGGLAAVGLLPSGGASSDSGSSNSETASSSSGAPGFAGGGVINGPGTGTSDSILARLSNGEFIVTAKAVRAYGARLFHAFNNLSFPGFADGGDVSDSAQVDLGDLADSFGASSGQIDLGALTDRLGASSGQVDLADLADKIGTSSGQVDLAQIANKRRKSSGQVDLAALADKLGISSAIVDLFGGDSDFKATGFGVSGFKDGGLIGAIKSIGSAWRGASKFLSGGLLSGPGTGTSDSILARLSNGEFVMNAKAVGAFGADFFHSLNNLKMPGFAMGGAIGTPALASLPAFTGGGVARQPAHAGMIPFTLDQGGRSYELMAPHETVRELRRHSTASRMTSTTKRAPSWDRG